MRTKTVFKSRWWALVWCAGIIWGVYDFMDTPLANTDTPNAADNADVDATMAALNIIK